MKPLKLLLAIAALCAFCLYGCAVSEFIKYNQKPDYPRDETQTLKIPGLQAAVKVYFDEGGIAHIEAQNELDLLRAIGFTQSRQRFFGMDAMRRIARGRMSELVGNRDFMGATTIDFDLSMRGWGLDERSADDVANLTPEDRELLQAFVDGVNEALKYYKPIEYRLLQVEPMPWTLQDTFALGRLLGWSLTHNYHQETSRLLLALNVGLERAQKIYGNDWWHGGLTLPPQEGEPRQLPPAIAEELKDFFAPQGKGKTMPGSKDENGKQKDDQHINIKTEEVASRLASEVVSLTGASNSWVVAGELSASGSPIVANDPHISHMIPSLFYQQHIKAPGLDAIGATVAGIPYVLMGHSRKVAWGATSAVSDAIDLYIEKTDSDHPGQYLTPDGWKKFEDREYIIRVRKGSKLKDQKLTIRFTRHGPLMNDMYSAIFDDDDPPVAMRWEVPSISGSITAVGRANRAETVEELRHAFADVATPAQSWNAADVNGDIAHFMTGVLPRRKNHLGTFPVPGWIDKYDWDGMIDPLDLPHAQKNQGYYAHANNLTVNPQHWNDYFQIDSAPSYRVDRISDRLEAEGPHDLESMSLIQGDMLSLRALRILPGMLVDLKGCPEYKDRERKALELLSNWKGETPADSAATAIFFMTYREAIMLALEDELDHSAFEFILSQRYSTNVADLWFDDPAHVIWDNRQTEKLETRSDVMRKAFKQAVKNLRKKQGANPSDWQWGELHDMHLKHVFGGNALLGKTLNLKKTPVGGALDTVWKSHFDMGHPKHPFRAMAGPAYRMIVDLSDMEHGKWISDVGISAWPKSPHYGDQHEMWKNLKYLPMCMNWKEIAESAKALMTLEPEGE